MGSLFTSKFWSRVRAANKNVQEHNVTGDGATMGGLIVVKKGGETIYRFLEEDFGDSPPLDAVLQAAKDAAAAAS